MLHRETRADTAFPPRTQAFQALGALMLACLCSFADRHLLTLLVPEIQHDLRVSDTQIGLLQGFAFGVLYSVMAVPSGWAVDHVNRRNIVAAGISLWCLAAGMSGLAHSFTGLFVARICIGIGEAALMPAAYSMIADYFPGEQRGRAFSAFTVAAYLGGGGAYVIGGAVLSSFSGVDAITLPLFGALPVWRAAFIIVGLPGLLVAALILTVREPVRRGLSALPDQPRARAADRVNHSLSRYARAHSTAFILIWSAYTLLTYVSFGLTPWAPILVARKFALPMHQVGTLIGLTTMIAGVCGALIGGALGDRWTSQGVVGGRFRLILIAWIGVLPAVLGFTLSPRASWSIAFFGLFFVLISIGYVSASAVVQEMVPATMRGRAIAFWYLVTGVGGQGLGPITTALLTDRVFHNQAALPYSIIAMAVPAALLGAVVSLRALRYFDRIRDSASHADPGVNPYPDVVSESRVGEGVGHSRR
jgi:MFS family permease